MKKYFSLLMAAAATFAFADNKDPVFNAEQLEAIHAAAPQTPAVRVEKPRKVLLFSRTAGYRHRDGIVGAREAFDFMGKKLGAWEIVASEDVSQFEVQQLKEYDAVILCHTTADFFGKDSANYTKNLMDYVKQGGGVFAIHAGVDCYNYDRFRNKDFTDMLGGEFIAHPWGGDNAPETIVIDDQGSSITKGIWQEDGFRIRDEIYMVGKSYDRSKCRVLMRIDASRSPVTTEWGRNIKFRDDGDLALIWIKNYGKGRVAYGGFCHGWQNYKNPKMQELYMRLLQFTCGDLKADTTSLPFTNKSVYIPMVDKPTIEEIKSLSSLKYGEGDAEINKIIFGVCANNTDTAYCKQLEKFIANELKNNSGSELYRGLLAELLWATRVDANKKTFAKIAKSTDVDALRSRLQNVVAHESADGEMPFKAGEKMSVPSEKPENRAVLLKTIRFLSANPDVSLPSWLTFDNLDENAKAHLVYAKVLRGDSLDEVFKLKPQSSELTVAIAFAVANKGKLSDIAAVIAGANTLSAKDRALAASYLASVKSDKIVEKLFDMLKTANGAEAALIIETATKFDLESMVSKLFDGFEKMSPEMKLSAIKAAESIANKDVFLRAIKVYSGETDKKVRSALAKTMMKSAQNDFDAVMFASVREIAKKVEKAEMPFMLRFAGFCGNEEAIEFCKDAYRQGLKEEAIKALGSWRNQDAIEPLMAIAKATRNEREKTLAQMSMVQVGERAGMAGEAVSYLIKNAMRGDEKDKAVAIAVKYPSPDAVAALEAAKFTAEANKAKETLKKIKPKFLNFTGSDMKSAIDGNINSRWSSGVPMKESNWIAFDFGYPRTVSELVFKLGSSRNDFPNKVQVFAGLSLESARKINATFSYEGNVAIVKFPKTSAKVFKIVCAENKTNYWWSIHEIEIK